MDVFFVVWLSRLLRSSSLSLADLGCRFVLGLLLG